MSTDNMKKIKDIFTSQTKAEFFMSNQGIPIVSVEINGRQQAFIIGSTQFNDFMMAYGAKNDLTFSSHFTKELDSYFRSMCYGQEKKDVYVRVGNINNKIYIDLSNSEGSFLEITEDGVSCVKQVPAVFLRPNKQMSLPNLVTPWSKEVFLNHFKSILNLKDPEEWILILSFILKTLDRDDSAFPILLFGGGQGTSKSITSKRLKMLIDPTKPLLSAPPHNPEVIRTIANSSYFMAFDNLSHLTPQMADTFCRISTGGGISTRSLYTDDVEKIYDLQRPTMLNGIDEPSNRPDFLERCVCVEMAFISPERRKSESILQKEFDLIYAGLFTGICHLLRECKSYLPNIQTTNLPRMTEYARMGIALEKVLGLSKGHFLNVYNRNLGEQSKNLFWTDDICITLYQIVVSDLEKEFRKRPFVGTTVELLARIKSLNKSDAIPKTSRGLSAILKRLEPTLKSEGIIVERLPRRSSRREIVVRHEEPNELIDTHYQDL